MKFRIEKEDTLDSYNEQRSRKKVYQWKVYQSYINKKKQKRGLKKQKLCFKLFKNTAV